MFTLDQFPVKFFQLSSQVDLFSQTSSVNATSRKTCVTTTGEHLEVDLSGANLFQPF